MIISFDVGKKNLAYCILRDENTIVDWKIVSMSSKDIYDIAKEVLNNMKMLYDIYSNDISIVIIENQPCMKNPTMKSIQMIIFTFFMMNDVEVRLMSASNKLKVMKNDNNKEKLSYSQKKKKSIELTYKYLEGNSQAISILNAEKKKDDLADCYLQAVYYLNK